ncbi:hypothetical protein VF13_04555 [Nostoc linckia z16]|nr:hypothetical protein VF13_04555 [Nostoc linckia z16]
MVRAGRHSAYRSGHSVPAGRQSVAGPGGRAGCGVSPAAGGPLAADTPGAGLPANLIPDSRSAAGGGHGEYDHSRRG